MADVIDTVKDPVCGMEVDPRKAAAWRERRGRTFHFCSTVCAKSFDEDPERFVHAADAGRPS
ncbi:MAG: YHS domain-containing protein [Myxococcota bacterium]